MPTPAPTRRHRWVTPVIVASGIVLALVTLGPLAWDGFTRSPGEPSSAPDWLGTGDGSPAQAIWVVGVVAFLVIAASWTWARRPSRDPESRVFAPPAGWYPDPHGVARLRYWDGTRWTEDTAP